MLAVSILTAFGVGTAKKSIFFWCFAPLRPREESVGHPLQRCHLLQHRCCALWSGCFTFWQPKPSRQWRGRREEASARCIKRRKKRCSLLQVVGLNGEEAMCALPSERLLNSASLGTFRARVPGNFQSVALLLAEISNYTGLLVIRKVLLN